MRHALLIASGLMMSGISWSADSTSGQIDAAASTAPALILDAQELKPDKILATRKIVSEQATLGPGNMRFPVVHGSITIGTPIVSRQRQTGSKNLMPAGKAEESQLYLIEFPFTLEPPLPKRRYKKAVFKVHLYESEAQANKLMPMLVASKQDVEQEFDLGFVITIPGPKSDSTLGEISAQSTEKVHFTRLIPRMTAYGIGTDLFRWELEGLDGEDDEQQPIIPGARKTAAVIQVPKGTKLLKADIGWDVEMQRTRFHGWFDVPVVVEGVRTDIPLL
jgi:hypothetical protein